MSKTEATPRPWKARDDEIIGPRGNIIAECCGYSVKAIDPAQQAQGGREANAELIVWAVNAHDDLLAACRLAFECLCKLEADSTQVVIDAIDAAIAQAEK